MREKRKGFDPLKGKKIIRKENRDVTQRTKEKEKLTKRQKPEKSGKVKAEGGRGRAR